MMAATMMSGHPVPVPEHTKRREQTRRDFPAAVIGHAFKIRSPVRALTIT
jgi:hypothetical protein